ncbi:MAG: TatD family hydrolase [Peptostreptococcaceae bacterium]|nr:TatD family hydrolase [Peptostreptococcaceae bacterium]
MLFDTHVHIDSESFDEDRSELLKLIQESPVDRFVNIADTIESSRRSIALAKKYPFIYAAIGIHPHEAASITPEDMDILRDLSKEEKVVAIGEIGLDYYYDFAPKDVQKKWFIEQIRLAEELELPYIVHSRDASKDTFDIIAEHTKKTSFVLHCYSQSAEMVKGYVDLGGYISFAGPLTFKNSKNLPEALKAVPLDRLLIETDSPYLSPVPLRGKRNDPRNVHYVALKVAEILGMSYEDICKLTYRNANRFFRI